MIAFWEGHYLASILACDVESGVSGLHIAYHDFVEVLD